MVREGARLDLNATANVSPYADPGRVHRHVSEQVLGAADGAHRHPQQRNRRPARPRDRALLRLHRASRRARAARRGLHGGRDGAADALDGARQRAALRALGPAVYGVPIPQVDQMPAGLIPVFLLAFRLIREGRHTFTDAERAQVELARYRCFLLGLPEDLLADTPEGVVRMMTARNTTLREGFDDETCGTLIRATLAAYLPPDRSLANQRPRSARAPLLQADLRAALPRRRQDDREADRRPARPGRHGGRLAGRRRHRAAREAVRARRADTRSCATSRRRCWCDRCKGCSPATATPGSRPTRRSTGRRPRYPPPPREALRARPASRSLHPGIVAMRRGRARR